MVKLTCCTGYGSRVSDGKTKLYLVFSCYPCHLNFVLLPVINFGLNFEENDYFDKLILSNILLKM